MGDAVETEVKDLAQEQVTKFWMLTDTRSQAPRKPVSIPALTDGCHPSDGAEVNCYRASPE